VQFLHRPGVRGSIGNDLSTFWKRRDISTSCRRDDFLSLDREVKGRGMGEMEQAGASSAPAAGLMIPRLGAGDGPLGPAGSAIRQANQQRLNYRFYWEKGRRFLSS